VLIESGFQAFNKLESLIIKAAGKIHYNTIKTIQSLNYDRLAILFFNVIDKIHVNMDKVVDLVGKTRQFFHSQNYKSEYIIYNMINFLADKLGDFLSKILLIERNVLVKFLRATGYMMMWPYFSKTLRSILAYGYYFMFGGKKERSYCKD